MPIRRDVDIWRGNSLPVQRWAFPDGYEPALAEIQLTVWVGSDMLFEVSTGNGLAVDHEARVILWAITVAQSRLIPFGRFANYELEDRNGTDELTLYAGRMNGLGGSNTDTGTVEVDNSLDFSISANSGNQLLGWI